MSRPTRSPVVPRMFAVSTRRLWLTVGVASVLAAGLLAHDHVWQRVRTHPYFAIDAVAVRGAGPLLTDEEVRSWLGIGAGDSLWDIDPRAIEERLRAHPIIARAQARRTFPHTFEVAVRERQARAMLLLDDVFYVDRRGEAFGPLAARHGRDYPVITGVRDGDPPGYRKWALRRALHLLRRCEKYGCPIPVSELQLDAARGIVLYPRQPAVPVILGWTGWDARIAGAARVLRAWDGATERLAQIDARFLDQVVVTLQPPRTKAVVAAEKGGVST